MDSDWQLMVRPLDRPYGLQGSAEDLLAYEDEVVLRLPVTVSDSAPTGNTSLAPVTGKYFSALCQRKLLKINPAPFINGSGGLIVNLQAKSMPKRSYQTKTKRICSK